MPDLDRVRAARIYLARAAEPPAPALARLVELVGPVDAADRVRARTVPPEVAAETADHHTDSVHPTDFSNPDRGIHVLIPEDTDTWPSSGCAALTQPSTEGELPLGAPIALWIRSAAGPAALPALLDETVSITGTAAPTAYGEHTALMLGSDLASAGVTVVAGSSYGIAGAALRGALTHRAQLAVAVLACGIDVDYPSGHRGLLAEIADHGAVLTEHPPGTAPTRRRFLARHRLIAAFSPVLVIAEAGLRSGSLAAAETARKLGRTVMAIPGPITSVTSRGNNQLLRDRTAIAVTCTADVLDACHTTPFPATAAGATARQDRPASGTPDSGATR